MGHTEPRRAWRAGEAVTYGDINPPSIDLDAPLEQRHPLGSLLRGMNWLLVIVCGLLGFIAMTLVFIGGAVGDIRDGAGGPRGNAIVSAPSRVQLVVWGGAPAAEAIGHIGYLDGSEAEYAPGAYDVTSLAGAQLQITAGPGETGCRIIVNNELVSEEIAFDHGQATCRWDAVGVRS